MKEKIDNIEELQREINKIVAEVEANQKSYHQEDALQDLERSF